MKFVLTGSLGNISKPLAQTLIASGYQVTVISSQPERAKDIEELGAIAAIGSIHDTSFLKQTFRGADGVYIMVPPDFTATNYREYFGKAARSYAEAIKASGIKRVVNLSSMGAHLPDGTGPIKGLYHLEHILNALEGIGIVHLRPAFFYTNFYSNMAMIRHAGILGANYPAGTPLVMVHPADVADTIAAWLQRSFTGKSVQYVASEELIMSDITAILGAAIGKPELPWVEFSDGQSYKGMTQGGLPEELARNYVEMGNAVKTGVLWEDYRRHQPELSPRKFREFAQTFADKFEFNDTQTNTTG